MTSDPLKPAVCAWIGGVLDDVVRGESVNGRALVVERFERAEDIGACQILFVGQVEVKHYDDLFASLEGRPILTVSDADGFTVSGGTIRLVTMRDRIRLRINLEAATAARLTISSKVLRSAEIVSTRKPR